MTVHHINEAGADKPTQSIIYINPPMARRLLERNTRNRPISEGAVARLFDEMTSGRWRYNGEAIKWSVDNVLLDGQHRLTALERIPDGNFQIPFLVVRGLDVDAQDTMDQGRTRTAADQMSIDGLTAGSANKTIAGAIRIYLEWQGGILFADRVNKRVGNTQVLDWAHRHPVELVIMKEISGNTLRRVKCRPSITLAVLTHFYLIDGEQAREFTEGLLSGAGLEAGNPILTLRERLDRAKSQAVRISDRDVIAFFLLAWNAWRQGRLMTKFQRPVGGSWEISNFPRAI
jgi:hypothetical protein